MDRTLFGFILCTCIFGGLFGCNSPSAGPSQSTPPAATNTAPQSNLLGGTSSGGIPAFTTLAGSPTSGAVPLTVEFQILVKGCFVLDFGDGSTPADITAESCSGTTHTYTSSDELVDAPHAV